MKLNLLPTHVASQSRAPVFIGAAVALSVVGILLAVVLTVSSQQSLAAARQELADSKQAAADALATANHATEIAAKGQVINTNLMLAKAMDKHNSAYVEAYETVMPYIPSFYRVTSMTAVPAGEGNSTITLTGQIKTFEQYADVALAFWRVPGVTNVQRSGYQVDDAQLTGLSDIDQKGSVVKAGEQPLPSDPLEKMDAMIQRAQSEPQGFLNTGNFGNDGGEKGPMPGWSTVTMVLTLNKELRTPDPRATLGGAGGGGGGAASGFPGGGRPGGFPGAPGGPPGAPGPRVPSAAGVSG